MITIAVVNMKGGSAKSSTCYHLGGMLARRGGKVLLVDDDPQSSLTQGFWGPRGPPGPGPVPHHRRRLPGRPAARGGDPPDRVRRTSGSCPATSGATEWNMLTAVRSGATCPLAIAVAALARSGPSYDYCLIDCPPNLHLCTFAALMAADFVLVPLQAEDFGAQGMVAVNRAIAHGAGAAGRAAPRPGLPADDVPDERLAVHQAYAANAPRACTATWCSRPPCPAPRTSRRRWRRGRRSATSRSRASPGRRSRPWPTRWARGWPRRRRKGVAA